MWRVCELRAVVCWITPSGRGGFVLLGLNWPFVINKVILIQQRLRWSSQTVKRYKSNVFTALQWRKGPLKVQWRKPSTYKRWKNSKSNKCSTWFLLCHDCASWCEQVAEKRTVRQSTLHSTGQTWTIKSANSVNEYKHSYDDEVETMSC